MSLKLALRSRPAALIVSAIAAATLACSGFPGVVETSVPLAPIETEDPLPLSNGAFSLVNDSRHTICFLYVSPTSSDDWGESRLGPAGSIGSGETQTLQVASGDYDLRAEDCDSARVAEVRGVPISDAGFVWAIPDVPVTVRMVNNSGTTVCYVFISPSSDPAWGGDWLGASETIDPGGSRDFAVPPGEDFDMMAADCDKNALDDQRGIPIIGEIYTWTIPGP